MKTITELDMLSPGLILSAKSDITAKNNELVDQAPTGSSQTTGFISVIKPKDDLIEHIEFKSFFLFDSTDYSIANFIYLKVQEMYREKQREIIKNHKQSSQSEKRQMFNDCTFTLNLNSIKNEYGAAKYQTIARAATKILDMRVKLIYKKKNGQRQNRVSSGYLCNSHVETGGIITFKPSLIQQLNFLDDFRIDFMISNDGSMRRYHNKNHDFRGLVGLSETQKMVIIYLSDRFEKMHKANTDKTIELKFSNEQIIECRNFDVYESTRSFYEFDESKLNPEHNNDIDRDRIKKRLRVREKGFEKNLRRSFKDNIKKLCEMGVWEDYFKIAKDGKSARVSDFTRIQDNPCKRAA